MSYEEFRSRITDPEVKDLMIEFFVRDLSTFGLRSKARDEIIEILADDAEDWTLRETNALIALWSLLGKPKIKLITKVDLRFYRSVVVIHHDFWNSLDLELLRPYFTR